MRTLDGIRVIELGQYIAGPYCAMLLGDQGAEVIKVERPGVGDPRRGYDPVLNGDGPPVSGGFWSYNRNKKSLTLNLQEPEGREVFVRLVRSADVIVENLRPGAMDRLGLGWDRLREENPRLVYCAISGFGRLDGFRGPYAERPAFDAAVQAMGGFMSLIGEADGPPEHAPAGFADIYTAVFAALGVSLALYARERTGHGTFVDQAMYDTIVSLIERSLMIYEFTKQVPTRGIDRFAPVGALRASDGYVATIIPTDEMWKRFCTAIERPDLLERDDLRTVLDRSERFHDVIRPEAELWTAQRPRQEVAERLAAHGLPAGEVQTVDEVFSCPQVEARRMLLELDRGGGRPVRLARTPLLFSEYDPVPASAPPELGADTEAILRDLPGASAADVARWAAAGVV